MNIGSVYLSNGKTEFTVWAPLKEQMILHIVYPFDKKIAMKKNQSGYFSVEADAEHGSHYFFMPDAIKDFPDPASKFQPEGVHGPSEVVNNSYEWNDVGWKGIPFDELILYEGHTGTFTPEGTFEAMIMKLDHLISTGINAIELMPVSQFPGTRNWGYDGTYPYAIQNSYGGPVGLKKLIDACHQKKIAVFLDVVYNHLGPEGNYLEEFAPYFTEHYKTPWGKAINFDGPYSDGVREFFSENALYLFEQFHVDGLRFDAIHEVYDSGAVNFWELLHKKIKKLEQKSGRPLYTIAESDLNSPVVTKPIELGGYGFTAQWMDDFHHALYTLVDEKGKKLYADFGKMDQLVKAYKDGFVHSGEYVEFRKKKFGASSAGIDGDNFIVFADNHDQAGNRATGDRLVTLINFEKIKLASAAYLLAPYIPMLFMGEEYGDDAPFLYFISHSDKELVKLVQKGRQKAFGQFDWETRSPDPFDEETFQKCKLKWENIGDKKQDTIHRWYKQLIRLRKTYPALQNFNKNNVWVSATGSLVELHRRSACQGNEVICLFNFSEISPLSFSFPGSQSGWNKIIDSNERQWLVDETGHEPLPNLIQPGEKMAIPSITAVAYETNDSSYVN